jgi:hypothetical protein
MTAPKSQDKPFSNGADKYFYNPSTAWRIDHDGRDGETVRPSHQALPDNTARSVPDHVETSES